jgi:hypothetical protein
MQKRGIEKTNAEDSPAMRCWCNFVIELKNGPFKPEYAGKLSFYLSAVDGIMRTAVDGPSIGVLLCESRSGPIVVYTLQNIVQPIGVSTYRVTRELPELLQAEVPSRLARGGRKATQGTERGPPGTRDGCGGVMTGEPREYRDMIGHDTYSPELSRFCVDGDWLSQPA